MALTPEQREALASVARELREQDAAFRREYEEAREAEKEAKRAHGKAHGRKLDQIELCYKQHETMQNQSQERNG